MLVVHSSKGPEHMSDRVTIFDTTLRDGEQSCGCSMTVAEKLRMARKLVDLGVDVLEAGFPAASEGDLEAVDRVAREHEGARVAALARCHPGDIEAAARALAKARKPRIHTFIATSPIHLKHKLKKTAEEALEIAVKAIEQARRYVDDVEFSAEDATRTSMDVLLRFSEAVVAAGATTVNLPDTVGYTTPQEMGQIIGQVSRALAGRAIVSVHCHDDLGLAVANSLAGVQAGARQIECTINGIGERAGNCSLEEVVMAMNVRKDVYTYATGIQTEQLYPTSRLLSELIGFDPQPNKAIVGKNAFAHEAGIHQDGFLKERTTYEIMDPRSVGVPSSRLVLGKHSGRHALADRCQHLGFSLTAPQVDTVYRQFIALCDHKKWVPDEEIAQLARNAQATVAA
jgi:2-isopropylmalate synthase